MQRKLKDARTRLQEEQRRKMQEDEKMIEDAGEAIKGIDRPIRVISGMGISADNVDAEKARVRAEALLQAGADPSLQHKNTFLHFEEGSDDEEEPQLGGPGGRRCKSDTVQHLRALPDYKRMVQELYPATHEEMKPPVQDSQGLPVQDLNIAGGSPNPGNDSSAATREEMKPPLGDSQGNDSSAATHEEVKPPVEDSQGGPVDTSSSGHYKGTCKPCIFFHRPGGCTKGDECKHCHLCDKDEPMRRKKSKQDHFAKLKAEQLKAGEDLPLTHPSGPADPPKLARTLLQQPTAAYGPPGTFDPVKTQNKPGTFSLLPPGVWAHPRSNSGFVCF